MTKPKHSIEDDFVEQRKSDAEVAAPAAIRPTLRDASWPVTNAAQRLIVDTLKLASQTSGGEGRLDLPSVEDLHDHVKHIEDPRDRAQREEWTDQQLERLGDRYELYAASTVEGQEIQASTLARSSRVSHSDNGKGTASARPTSTVSRLGSSISKLMGSCFSR
jgi:hypothetical protein